MNLLTQDEQPVPHRESHPFSIAGPAPTTTQTQAPYDDSQSAQSSDEMEVDLLQRESILIHPGFQVSEADNVLSDYMVNMTPEFPFVPLRSGTSSWMLKKNPLLTKTILGVCRPPAPDVSAAFEKWFRKTIAHETVVLGKKNIELVQSILVFLAW